MRFRKFDFFEKCPGPIFQKPAKNGVLKNPVLPGSKIPLLAIHKIISHVWEDAPRKVNNDEPDLRFFYGNFWPAISGTVRKPCFSTSIPRGPNLCILDFQTPPAPAPAPPDEFSNPDPGPLPTHPGMKYFRKGIPCSWPCKKWRTFSIIGIGVVAKHWSYHHWW